MALNSTDPTNGPQNPAEMKLYKVQYILNTAGSLAKLSVLSQYPLQLVDVNHW